MYVLILSLAKEIANYVHSSVECDYVCLILINGKGGKLEGKGKTSQAKDASWKERVRPHKQRRQAGRKG